MATIIVPKPQKPLTPKDIGIVNAVIITAIEPYRGIEEQDPAPDKPIGIGSLGNPVYSDITFEENSYLDASGNKIPFDGVNLQTVIMVVDQAKRIVSTNLIGSDYDAVEYIGLGPYMVQISGIIDGPNGVYPASTVSALITLLSAPKAQQVTSWYLQQFGIEELVVTDYIFPQIPGVQSSQQFTINAISSKSVEATITEQ